MDTASCSPRPGVHPALASFLFHRNPFYLLSALCMIAGCYLLNSGLALHTGELPRLLLLIGTLDVYEMLLIALGLYLIHNRGVIRDGTTLLLLEAPFLVDLAFLNAEIAQIPGPIGLWLNVLMFGLALLKVTIILRVLFGRLPIRPFAVIAFELTFLFALPTVFKAIAHNGALSDGQFYSAWFLVALVPVIYELQSRLLGDYPSDANDSGDAMHRIFIRRLYVGLPFLSLVAHVGMLHWVYNVTFHRADAAWLLMGLTVSLARVNPNRAIGDDALRFLRGALPIAAVLLACGEPPFMSWPVTSRVTLTPIIFTLAAAYVTYVYLYLWQYALYCIGGATAALLVIQFGPTPGQAISATASGWSRIFTLLKWLIPSTAVQWGGLAVAAAFGFLGIGARISLRRSRDLPPPVSVIDPR
jgi:hypothetical protein